jgi:acyl carrier protein
VGAHQLRAWATVAIAVRRASDIMSTTFARLSAILHKDYAVAPELLSMDSALDGLGIDSLGVVELLFTIEESFELQLPSEPVPMATVGDVVRFIDLLLAAQVAPLGARLALAD